MSLFRRRQASVITKNAPAGSLPEAQPLNAPSPLPPFLRDNDIRTSVAPDAVITGKLSFTTTTRIEGRLKGEVGCTQRLIIGPSAVVEGWVRANELQIEGMVRGEITETRKVEIRPGGKFIGRLDVRVLVIQDGGLFDGECRMGLEEPSAVRNKA